MSTSTLPSRCNVLVIGAGIVGNSLVHHLAELGWTDIVQIDKGPLPNPGGSTGHASNFIFPVDHSREITDLTLDSMRQYEEMGVLTTSGGFEVARTEERMEELRRRMSSARAWGIEASLVSPEEVAEQVADVAVPCGICGTSADNDVRVGCPHGCGQTFHSGCHKARLAVYRGDSRFCAVCSRRVA